jgi:hypothetical protein
MRMKVTAAVAAVLVFGALACAEAPTTALSIVDGSALAKDSGCQGLDNARSRGAEPQSSISCGPVTVTPTDVVFAEGSSGPFMLTVRNNAAIPVRLYTLYANLYMAIQPNYAASTCPRDPYHGMYINPGQTCTIGVSREQMSAFTTTGYIIFKWHMAYSQDYGWQYDVPLTITAH